MYNPEDIYASIRAFRLTSGVSNESFVDRQCKLLNDLKNGIIGLDAFIELSVSSSNDYARSVGREISWYVGAINKLNKE
jgi:hypothetical protein